MEYQQYLDRYVSYDSVLARRCWAAIIDYIVFTILLFLYIYLTGSNQDSDLASSGNSGLRNLIDYLFIIIIWFLYYPLLESIFGYTPGKGIFDLKVIQQDKRDFPFVVSLKRHLLDPFDYAFVGVVGILTVKFSKEHKRLGDMWAKSLVVKDE
jgi:uncharacterized RDD family membrane protein YckC